MVSLCVSLLDTTAELIEVPFGMGTLVGPRGRVLGGGADTPRRRDNLGEILGYVHGHYTEQGDAAFGCQHCSSLLLLGRFASYA